MSTKAKPAAEAKPARSASQQTGAAGHRPWRPEPARADAHAQGAKPGGGETWPNEAWQAEIWHADAAAEGLRTGMRDFTIEPSDGGDPARFAGVLFAEDFEGVDPGAPFRDAAFADAAPPAPPPLTEQDVDRAHASGYAEGLQTALADAGAAAARAEAAAAEALATVLQSAAEQAEASIRQRGAELAAVVLRTLDALLPELCAHHGAAEAAALTGTILPMLTQQPRLVLRAHPATLATLARLACVRDAAGQGRLQVSGADQMLAGDIAIEWQDGALRRDAGALLPRLHAMLSGDAAAEAAPAPPGASATAAAAAPTAAAIHPTNPRELEHA